MTFISVMASAGPSLESKFSRSLSVGGTGRVLDDRDDTSKDFMLRMEEVWREDRFCDITIDVEGEKVQCYLYTVANTNKLYTNYGHMPWKHENSSLSRGQFNTRQPRRSPNSQHVLRIYFKNIQKKSAQI